MDDQSARAATISLITAHGRQSLEGDGGDRLIDVLMSAGVPWSAVSTYVVDESGAPPRLQPCLGATLGELAHFDAVFVYLNRNVNPLQFDVRNFDVVPAVGPGAEATEYIYQQFDNATSSVRTDLKKLTDRECREVVRARVGDTIRAQVPDGATVVIGISGGGDSNALLEAMVGVADGRTLRPVILTGIPDWDAGVPRARALCERYGLDLKVVAESEVRELLGVPEDGIPLVDRFERAFPGDDFEFLGTLLIRIGLFAAARALGTSYACTGLNLEDVVCESLARLARGAPPAAFPRRDIGEMTLVFPLWQCPKRIIDGCFPTWSRENYEMRYPSFALGRNLYYSVAFALQSQFPGYLERLAVGLSSISAAHPADYVFDDQLGFHVEGLVPLGIRRRFTHMLGQDLSPKTQARP